MVCAPDHEFGKGAQRPRAVALTCAVHALALAVFLIPLAAASPPAKRPNLVTFDSPVPGPRQPAPTRSKQPKKVPPRPQLTQVPPPVVELPIVTPQVVALLEQADAEATTGGCDLTPAVQAALQSNAAVQKELPTIPAQRRSVANAIAIWNQDWAEPDAGLNSTALETIRVTIATTIAAASETCRLQPQGGPRLIYIPGKRDAAAETTVLALGSGEWTWQQIADTAHPNSLAQFAAAAPLPLPNASGRDAVSLFAEFTSQ